MDKNCKKIAQTIEQRWNKGIDLSRDALFFLESTYGVSTLKEIGGLLDQEDFSDRQTILEMILFPGQTTRLSIEPLLNPCGLTSRDELDIFFFLANNHPKLNLLHPKEENTIVINLPLDQVKVFISRLFVSRSIDPVICDALKKNHPASVVIPGRVLFRCKNITFNKKQTQFITRFIRKARNRKHQFLALFEMVLSIICDAPESGDLDTYLLKRQVQEKTLLKQIQKFEEKRDQYSMEYLMMSKYQVPPESLELVEERLNKLDLIMNDILCIPPIQRIDPPVQDLGRFNSDQDMKKLLNILS